MQSTYMSSLKNKRVGIGLNLPGLKVGFLSSSPINFHLPNLLRFVCQVWGDDNKHVV